MDVKDSYGCQRISWMPTVLTHANGSCSYQRLFRFLHGSLGFRAAPLEVNDFYGSTTALVAFQQLVSFHNGYCGFKTAVMGSQRLSWLFNDQLDFPTALVDSQRLSWLCSGCFGI